MKKPAITNESIWQTDFARDERLAALARASCLSPQRSKTVPAAVWGQDVSASDPRSVKAYLNGRGDLRSSWWNFCSAVLGALGYTMEESMAYFHRSHHSLTFFRLSAISLFSARRWQSSTAEVVRYVFRARRRSRNS